MFKDGKKWTPPPPQYRGKKAKKGKSLWAQKAVGQEVKRKLGM